MDIKKQSEVRGPKSEVGGSKPGVGSPRSGIGNAEFGIQIARGRATPRRRRSFRSGVWALLASAWLLAASVAMGARKPTLEAIGNEVQCTCGCNAPLNQCPHLDCAQKAQMQTFIKQEIAGGKDETTILQDLSLRYGVQVLSTPPAHGFNLAIWILPSVGFLLGLGMAVVIARRWRRKPSPAAAPAAASPDPKLLHAVEEEMKSAGLGKI